MQSSVLWNIKFTSLSKVVKARLENIATYYIAIVDIKLYIYIVDSELVI